MTMLSAVVLCLLVAQSCQARPVQVQDLRSVDSRKLSDKGTNVLAFGENVADVYSLILQRCLADAACTDALAAVAADGQEQQQQYGRPSTDNDKILAFTAMVRQQQQQEQRRQQLAYSMDFASVTSGNLMHSGDGLGTIQANGDRRSGNGNKDIRFNTGGDGDGVNGNSVALGHEGGGGEDESADGQAGMSLKGLAALVLFLEAVAGMYLPLLLQRFQSPQWWLSLLNCFSGGIFLSAGIIHLLPHCAEAQQALGPIGPGDGDYPLYLVLVVVGYCVVFYVERVLFDVHGEGHAHCQHSNVYSHSSYYKAISHHRSQRMPMMCSGSAGTEPAALLLPASGTAAASPGYPARAVEAFGCTHSSKMDCEPQSAIRAAAEEPLVGREDSHAHPGHGHGHQHSHQHASHSQAHQHKGSRLSLAADEGEEGAAFTLPVSVDAAGVCMARNGAGADDDAESCHSDHPPRAVCVCVEEQEAEAEARGHHHHNHSHNNHNQKHQHLHKARGNCQQIHDLPGQGRRGSAGGRCAGSSGGGRGDFGDQLRVPLLLVDHVASKPPTPPLDDAGGIAVGIGGGGDSDDLPALAWQHLQAQHRAGQSPQLVPFPLHPPESCAYHTHHHLHPHHRYRRRSAGAGPLDGSCGSGGGAAVMDSGASSCTSPSQHLDDHHDTAPTGHHTHHTHHHVIKPRFRFMHGVVLLVALALHTALECIALGLIDSRPQFLLLFAAIASHKVVSALALSSRFLREGATLSQVTAYVGPFCFVAPASVLVGLYVGRVAPIARLVFSCFATGTFLYVGASEVIMEEFEGEMRADRRDISTRAARYIKFLAVLAAVALVAASGLLPEPDHH